MSDAPNECPLPDPPRCAYVDRNLAPETTYWYRVAAVNAAGMSAYSNVASARTGGEPPPTPGPGEIRGTVSFEDIPYFDLNGNGVRDLADVVLPPPPTGRIDLLRGQEVIETAIATSDAYSTYGFSGLAPGDYTVVAHFDLHWNSCGGSEFSYNPLQRDHCLDVSFPWDTTPPQEVTLPSDAGVTLNLVVRPADVAVVTGDAILEIDHASQGTSIVAFVHGQECGTTQVTGGANYDFAIQILGAEERPGCARLGDQVQFTVGGVPAIDSVGWAPFGSPPGSPGLLQYHHIVAMQQHAWYWFQSLGDNPPAAGTLVQAVIDGVICGEAHIESQGIGLAGFSKLIVPSAELQPGCGRAGANVSFLFDGVVKGEPIEWSPGLQFINPLVGPVILPTTGSAPSSSAAPWPAALALVAAGAALVAGGALATRRR